MTLIFEGQPFKVKWSVSFSEIRDLKNMDTKIYTVLQVLFWMVQLKV